MRIRALAALALIVAAGAALAGAACGAGGFFRQYEYDEEIFLSLDGSATVYVNSSVAALDALRGASFDTSPAAVVDREAVRQYFSAPAARVTRVSTSRRSGRRFVHVRMDVDDITKLGAAAPFAWSVYRFARDGDVYVYKQAVGAAAGKDAGAAGWDGRERVAFRLHLPSKITFHNSGGSIKRGNILVWEQPLADRLKGVPIDLEARMETQSILYRTLALFGATFAIVAVVFAVLIWWILRKGKLRVQAEASSRSA